MRNKITSIILTFLFVIILVSLPTPVKAQSPDGDKIVVGGNYVLYSGETLNGDLVVFGGYAKLENTSITNGDVVLIGGSLDISGEVTGSITAIGGSLNLKSTSIINGDVNTIAAKLTKEDGVVIRGNTGIQLPEDIKIPGGNELLPNINPDSKTIQPDIRSGFEPIRDFLWGIFQALALAALAALAALFFENQISRIGNTVITQPVQSGGLGLLTAIVAPGFILLLTITIILIPISVLGIFILGIALIAGWVSVGYEIGCRLSPKGEQNWAAPVKAGLGTLLLTVVTMSIGWIPCIGWTLGVMVLIIGLGGVMMSFFGTRSEEQNPISTETLPGPPEEENL